MFDCKTFRCDAEIGKPGAYHGCLKPASIKVMTRSRKRLDFCERHRQHAIACCPTSIDETQPITDEEKQLRRQLGY